jgi:uncharacterized membrane protein (Fun14 family)
LELETWKNYLPYLGAGIGFGLVSGWVVGFFFKKLAKIAALILGLLFVCVQIMVVNRWVQVNWPKVAASAGHLAQQVQGSQSSFWSVLLWNFPYAGSFCAGFAMGFKSG